MTDKRTDPQPRKNGDGRSNKNVNFGLAADRFAQLGGNDDGKK